MAYSALEYMRRQNQKRFGKDVGPFPPGEGAGDESLKGMALRFLHSRCQGLKFDPEKEAEEREKGRYLGTSFRPGQIPYNMEMDINRLCLEREMDTFLDSGAAEDAYTIYYCYLTMFLGQYSLSKKMVELLSEYEANGSSLLMKHRDHYSHSVYVFALGLAIYEASEAYRNAFKSFYGFATDPEDQEADRSAAHTYLEYWGLASLFHDIGYPFELPFEQVISYFEVDRQERGPGSVFMAYRDLNALTGISPEEGEHFQQMYGRTFESTNELFACAITKRMGETYNISQKELTEKIIAKPIHPEEFNYFMDHAWFSAARLYQELVHALDLSDMTEMHMDALTAILLHNSLYKFSVAYYKSKDKAGPPLKMDLHPLAYMLMLCDELQCWDRTAYGRNSRRELHPMDAWFDLSGGQITATYSYDIEEKEKIEEYEKSYADYERSGGDKPRLKAYSDMAEKEQPFRTDIERIVDLTELPLTVRTEQKEVNRENKHTYLSSSSFLHLYDFAIALNGRYQYQEEAVEPEQLEEEYTNMSLEYQLSNINQAKSFGKYLDRIGCFYTDRSVDYEMVRAFKQEEIDVFAPLEHERWVREHLAMGWTGGDDYETLASGSGPEERKNYREQMRMHKLAMNGDPAPGQIHEHYNQLSEEDQGKDYKPFNTMLDLIRKYDGLRIYRL